jgi:DsbC/DsbD-like thiol-disulfide interchange protein
MSASAFFGVCEIVCIPAQAQASLSLMPVAQSRPGTQLVQQWLARVPKPAEKGPVTAIHAGSEGGTVFLECELSRPVDDIFVEGSVRHYFAAPAFSGSRAKIRVAGTKLVDDLKGGSLRIVTSVAGQGLEQKLTVL